MRATRGIVRSCWRSEPGVAAVEFALAIPFVLLVLSGIIQFGFVLFLQNHVAGVARNTARRAAVGELAWIIGWRNGAENIQMGCP